MEMSDQHAEEDFADGDEDDAIDRDEEESEAGMVPLGCVKVRPSNFIGVPPTVFFEYPAELNIHREDVGHIEELGQRKLQYNCYWERICIRNAFRRAGFIKSDKLWTALWSKHQNPSQMQELNCLQKVNHFPSSWCVGRKDRLARTMNTMKRIHGNEYAFHPDTYVLPSGKDSLVRQLNIELQTNRPKSSKASKSDPGLWIVKPVASSCGRGIKVVTTGQALEISKKNKSCLVQKYLPNPYLIDGKKFDLRIYVLVSGVDPLRVYVHKEGLTRISTAKFNTKNTSNKFAHLTNYSINKKSKDFKAAEYSEDGCDGADREGFKWSLAAFKSWLSEKESPEIMMRTFEKIHDLCVKTMIAAESEMTPKLQSTANYRTNCFELFGCDVILDSKLEPHLLEVNVSPSLMGSSPLDKKIKGTLIADVFHVVGLYPHDSKVLRKFNETDVPSSLSTECGSAQSNPFAFTSLARLMASQEEWRKYPCPDTINLHSLEAENSAAWLILLMIEDELARAKASQFTCAHPDAKSVRRFTDLYRSARFSDHLLAKWILEGGYFGKNGVIRALVPTRFTGIPTKSRPSSASNSCVKIRSNSLMQTTASASQKLVCVGTPVKRDDAASAMPPQISPKRTPCGGLPEAKNAIPTSPRPSRLLIHQLEYLEPVACENIKTKEERRQPATDHNSCPHAEPDIGDGMTKLEHEYRQQVLLQQIDRSYYGQLRHRRRSLSNRPGKTAIFDAAREGRGQSSSPMGRARAENNSAEMLQRSRQLEERIDSYQSSRGSSIAGINNQPANVVAVPGKYNSRTALRDSRHVSRSRSTPPLPAILRK